MERREGANAEQGQVLDEFTAYIHHQQQLQASGKLVQSRNTQCLLTAYAECGNCWLLRQTEMAVQHV